MRPFLNGSKKGNSILHITAEIDTLIEGLEERLHLYGKANPEIVKNILTKNF